MIVWMDLWSPLFRINLLHVLYILLLPVLWIHFVVIWRQFSFQIHLILGKFTLEWMNIISNPLFFVENRIGWIRNCEYLVRLGYTVEERPYQFEQIMNYWFSGGDEDLKTLYIEIQLAKKMAAKKIQTIIQYIRFICDYSVNVRCWCL